MKGNKKVKKHKKIGFTLVELLAVIIILAAIMLIIIPLVTNNIREGSSAAIAQTKESIEMSAQNWASDNKNWLPETGGEICVSTRALIQTGYLDNNVSDDFINGGVLIANVNDVYYYTFQADECGEDNGLYKNITLDYETNGGTSLKNNTSNIIPALPGDTVDINNYEAVKDGYEFVGWNTNKDAHTGFTEYTMPTKDVTLYAIFKKTITAKFTIQNSKLATADATSKSCVKYNNETSCTITAPTLTSIAGTEVVGWSTDKDATTAELKSGALASIESNVEYFSIIKITDVTPPTCTLSLTGTKKDTSSSWYTSDVTVTITTSDEGGSGVDQYGITTSSQTTYNSKTTVVQTNDGSSIIYYGYVSDMVGNTGRCSVTFKKDATAPTCTLSLAGTTYNSWYTTNVTVSLTRDDTTSGVDSYGLTTSSTATYNSTESRTQSSDTTGVTYYGYVKDKAGNTTTCTAWFKKDATAPTCTLSLSGTKGDNSWYTSDVTVSLTRDDTTSKVAKYGLTTSSVITYNSTESRTQSSDTTGVTYYGYVQDNAGNTGNCTISFKKDAKAPILVSRIYRTNISTSEGNRNQFGYYVQDVTSGLSSSSSIFEYCYVNHNLSSCGATCSSGNQYSHKPSDIYGTSSNYYFQSAHFVNTMDGNTSQYELMSGVASSCANGQTTIANLQICDKAGNCVKNTKNETWTW